MVSVVRLTSSCISLSVLHDSTTKTTFLSPSRLAKTHKPPRCTDETRMQASLTWTLCVSSPEEK
jgi:hypothetical protein